MPPPEFDNYVESYSKNIDEVIGVFGKRQDFFTRNKAENLLPAFATVNKDLSKLKVLDVGCGIGMVHPYIAQSLGELHGTDVSGASIEIARKINPNVRYKEYDGYTLPYGDGSFDCAFAICVLHHVSPNQWLSFLKEMRRVVKPGGLVLFIEHNPLNPATQWVVKTCEYDVNAVLLNPWTLRRLMKSSGIIDPWVRYVLFTPFSGKAFRLLDRLLAAIPLGTQYVMGGKVAGGA